MSKKQKLVTTAKKLFWQHGVRRVTIEEICNEAGVSKMTFYKHFKNKVELALFIMQKFNEEGMQRYHNVMNSNRPFDEKIREIILLKLEQTEELSQPMFKDIHQNRVPELKTYFDQIAKKNIETILQDFALAQKNGDVRPDVNLQFLFYMLNQMLSMARDEKLQALYKKPQTLVIELTTFFFYGILPRQGEK
ncbi:MAG: TetR/AcrR family transcriptional regulator [Calditrichaeota bacterium]|nr:MAG: TetR/AcrR family transcriptional regulator [Calditrichota bacterium]